jgi:hypothetical protein
MLNQNFDEAVHVLDSGGSPRNVVKYCNNNKWTPIIVALLLLVRQCKIVDGENVSRFLEKARGCAHSKEELTWLRDPRQNCQCEICRPR